MNDKAKRALRIAEKVLVILVVAIAVFMMVFTIISVTSFDKTERSLFGLQLYIVKSDSMKKTHFKVGDLVVAKEFDPADKKDVMKLKVGSIITFQSTNEDSRGETITHQIISFEDYHGNKIEDLKAFVKEYKNTKNSKGEYPPEHDYGFVCVTKGTSVKDEDKARVETGYIYSTYLFDIPNAGTFFNFLKSVPGYISCILVPFLLLIGYQGFVCVRLFMRYRSEQLEGIRTREAQLDAERAEARRQMEELAELRAMLNQQIANNGAAQQPSELKREPDPEKEND